MFNSNNIYESICLIIIQYKDFVVKINIYYTLLYLWIDSANCLVIKGIIYAKSVRSNPTI